MVIRASNYNLGFPQNIDLFVLDFLRVTGWLCVAVHVTDLMPTIVMCDCFWRCWCFMCCCVCVLFLLCDVFVWGRGITYTYQVFCSVNNTSTSNNIEPEKLSKQRSEPQYIETTGCTRKKHNIKSGILWDVCSSINRLHVYWTC